MFRIIAAVIACITSSHLISQESSQDSIFLMNGHIIGSKITDTIPGSVSIQNPAKPAQKLNYESDQLFLVKFANGFERYYYQQDTSINNWLTRDDARMYMKGERDARKGYKARGALFGSAVAGIAGGMTGSFWGPLLPYGFMALSGIPRIRIRHETVGDTAWLKSDAYILGYERVARQKLKTKSLVGGTIGLAFGYGIYFFTNKYYPEQINFGFKK
jgi:hypothetical protein